MAQLLEEAREIRLDSDREVSPPAVLPDRMESPFSTALPRTVAGRQRMTPTGFVLPSFRLSSLHSRGRRRLDWAELGTYGLVLACAGFSIYRLFWAIQF